MKIILTLVAICIYVSGFAQQKSTYYNRAFEAKYMQTPPVFVAGKDSLRRFYFTHFPAFDTVISKAVEKGDTAKYIRIYFSFYIDENGSAKIWDQQCTGTAKQDDLCRKGPGLY